MKIPCRDRRRRRTRLGGLCLCVPAAVDQPNTRHRASNVISVDYLVAECRVPDLAVGEHLLDTPLLLDKGRLDQQSRLAIDVGGIELEPSGIDQGQRVPQSHPDNGSKVGGLDLPDRTSLRSHPASARLSNSIEIWL